MSKGTIARLLIAAAALAPAAAWAQDNGHHQGGQQQAAPAPTPAPAAHPHGGGAHPGGWQGHPGVYQGQPGQWQGRPGGYAGPVPQGAPQSQPHPADGQYRGPGAQPFAGGRPGEVRSPQDARAFPNGAYRSGGYDGRDWRRVGPDHRFENRPAWNSGWRQDRRYDWARYRAENGRLFHLRPYYAPHGWGYGYQRFGVGAFLYGGLFAADYWIDPGYYDLPPVYGPYRWVRYYDDALLVDVETGQVVDVINGIFY